MQHVVEVVVPLRVKVLLQQAGLVQLVFQDQPHMSTDVDLFSHAVCQFLQEAGVVDRVHGVQPQAVEAVFEQPHQGVVEKEIAHFAAVEVDTRAPRRVDVLLEEAFGVLAQVIAVGAEAVVDHVEDHGEAVPMGAVDQVFELLGCAVGRLRCVGQYAVVTPIAFAGELRQSASVQSR